MCWQQGVPRCIDPQERIQETPRVHQVTPVRHRLQEFVKPDASDVGVLRLFVLSEMGGQLGADLHPREQLQKCRD